jgi:uncharacterized protein YkwD
VKPLKSEERLLAAARAHSEEMARLGYFSHQSPTRGLETFADRISAAEVTGFSTAGENIIYREGYLDDGDLADTLLTQWMDSPPHRANILSPDYRVTGLGIYRDGQRIWATQVFVDRVAK